MRDGSIRCGDHASLTSVPPLKTPRFGGLGVLTALLLLPTLQAMVLVSHP